MSSKPTEPLVVNLAPTGMVPTREMTPHVPLSVDEVLDDVGRCRELGASIVHVHARDDEGAPTHVAERFAPIVEGIRKLDPELVVCVTCSGRFVSELERRAAVLELEGDAKPDLASLTLGSNNFRSVASVNSPEVIAGLAERMSERGIQPELEVFEPGMVQTGRMLAERGLIGPSPFINIILGNPGTASAEPAMLAAFLSQVPDGWNWSLGGIGRHQLAANTMAIACGGHVRVGLEDNIWWDRERTEHASNPRLVARVAEVAELCERPLATPAQTRELLGLNRSA
ncbi:MAG: 3-keto-5-aminohexanoate cleavage protein [Actinobacteria bacterium]|nr:3-keto-5-aminohexanoate cleavage protein [Actinomycetota bacterium]